LILCGTIVLTQSNQNYAAGKLHAAIIGYEFFSWCMLFSLALYAPYTFFFAIRTIALTVFLTYVEYALDMLISGKFNSSQSQPSVGNAVSGLFVWGLPSLMVYWFCRRPKLSPYDEQGRKLTVAEIIRSHGLIYVGDVLEDLSSHLPALPYTLIATACAERLHVRALRVCEQQHTLPPAWFCGNKQYLDLLWHAVQNNSDADTLLEQINGIDEIPDPAESDCEAPTLPAFSFPHRATASALTSYLGTSSDAALSAVKSLIAATMGEIDNELTSTMHPLWRGNFIARCCDARTQQDLTWIQKLLNETATIELTPDSIRSIRERAA
jgi:hypothetical protein